MKPTTDELRKRYRHMPHWEKGGGTYFVTFRSARGNLQDAAMRQVIQNILYDHGRRYELFFAVVMPDHVHILLKPLERMPGTWWGLAEITKGIKGTSARFINKLIGTTGAVWQGESFDRIVRDQNEYDEKLAYMWNNPVKAGMVQRAEDYEYFVFPPSG